MLSSSIKGILKNKVNKRIIDTYYARLYISILIYYNHLNISILYNFKNLVI